MKFYAIFALLLLALVAFTAAEEIPSDADHQPKDDLCICPRILDPVCGNDFETYPNRCEFDCAQKKMARKGRAIAVAHPGYC